MLKLLSAHVEMYSLFWAIDEDCMGKKIPARGQMDSTSNSRSCQQCDIPSKSIKWFTAVYENIDELCYQPDLESTKPLNNENETVNMSRSRQCNYNQKVPSSNPTSQGSWWPLGQICKNTVINIRWVRLPPQYWPEVSEPTTNPEPLLVTSSPTPSIANEISTTEEASVKLDIPLAIYSRPERTKHCSVYLKDYET